MPKVSKQYDFEAELAVVIGKKGYRLPKTRALSIVAGYSCFNDGSVRDYQLNRGPQWTLGKNFDASGGFEALVVNGGFEEGGESFGTHSWLRLPVGGSSTARRSATARIGDSARITGLRPW